VFSSRRWISLRAVPVQRPHRPDSREHCRAAKVDYQHQRLDRGLPLGGIRLLLEKRGDVGGIAVIIRANILETAGSIPVIALGLSILEYNFDQLGPEWPGFSLGVCTHAGLRKLRPHDPRRACRRRCRRSPVRCQTAGDDPASGPRSSKPNASNDSRRNRPARRARRRRARRRV
jgi:hypothetical protein